MEKNSLPQWQQSFLPLQNDLNLFFQTGERCITRLKAYQLGIQNMLEMAGNMADDAKIPTNRIAPKRAARETNRDITNSDAPTITPGAVGTGLTSTLIAGVKEVPRIQVPQLRSYLKAKGYDVTPATVQSTLTRLRESHQIKRTGRKGNYHYSVAAAAR
jgi:hypothetical protein